MSLKLKDSMVMQEYDLDRFGLLDHVIPYILCVVCLYWIEFVWRGSLPALIYILGSKVIG